MTTLNNDFIIEDYLFWKAIKEAEDNGTVVLTFGRFNPPTIGHKWLFEKILNVATKERGVPLVFTSHSQDKKTNPLSYDEKCELVSKILPKGLKMVKTKARNMKEILQELMPRKFRRLIVVVGDDRTDGFAWIDKNKEEFGYQKVQIVSSGARSGATAVQNASATAMREAAKAGNYDAFAQFSPFDEKTTRKVFDRIAELLK